MHIDHKYSKKGIELTGNVVSGDTYPVRDIIKDYWCGTWNSDQKTWTVDPDKVVETINNHWHVSKVFSVRPDAKSTLCPKCHTYCYGDCNSN